MRIENLCRPFGDQGHLFCSACCRPKCENLSPSINDGLGGCLAQAEQGRPRSEFCRTIRCWNQERLATLTTAEMTKLAEKLQHFPPGRYNPREILLEFNL